MLYNKSGDWIRDERKKVTKVRRLNISERTEHQSVVDKKKSRLA